MVLDGGVSTTYSGVMSPTTTRNPEGVTMTDTERAARLQRYASVRGVDRCLDNVARGRDVALWLDQAECYAGLMTAAEFNARHPY